MMLSCRTSCLIRIKCLIVLCLLPFTSAANALESTVVLSEPESWAEVIFYGGPIVTVNESMPMAEAVAVADGKILSVGDRATVFSLQGSLTEMVDLKGAALLPSFIDAHGHLAYLGESLDYADLAPPPVGSVSNFSGLNNKLLVHIKDKKLQPGDWVVGVGYDNAQLEEGRHPNRFDLDRVSDKYPIVLNHVSGHLLACNSLALALVGIDEHSPDPVGGVIQRAAGSNQPSGILEEHAMDKVFEHLPVPSQEQKLAQLRRAQEVYTSYGITTAQDGWTSKSDFALLSTAAERQQLIMDVIAYPNWRQAVEILGSGVEVGNYRNHFKVGGVKITLDGSPQGKTAFLSAPYHVPPSGKPKGYRGYPAMTTDEVKRWVSEFYRRDW